MAGESFIRFGRYSACSTHRCPLPQGLGPTLTAIGSSSLLYFYMYNLLKRVVERRGRALSVTANLVVAYIAGLFNAVLTSPLWVSGCTGV